MASDVEGLKKLEYLSLVSKVCTELESHLGFGDKVLAELITELGRDCETEEEFDSKLKQNGAEMPDYLVRTLLTIIHANLPRPDRKRDENKDGDGQKTAMFPGLTIRDMTEREARELTEEMEREVRKKDRGGESERSRHRDRDGDRRDRRRDRDGGGRERYGDRERDRGEDGRRGRHWDRDFLPLKKGADEDGSRTNPSGTRDGPKTRIGLSGIRISDDDGAPSRRPSRRMSSTEKWEAKQLIASGVMGGLIDNPMSEDEGNGVLYQEEGAEEELEVELNEDEPAFLNGQTRYSVDMSPVKIFKNTKGSLCRAAALQSALIKERREVREQEQRSVSWFQ